MSAFQFKIKAKSNSNSNPNQIFLYTCAIMPNRHSAQATQHFSKKCISGKELLATLCPI